MSESLIAVIIIVFVLTIGLLYIVFMIGYYYGKHIIDNETDILVNRLNRIERKADRALDQNKIQDLRISKLEE